MCDLSIREVERFEAPRTGQWGVAFHCGCCLLLLENGIILEIHPCLRALDLFATRSRFGRMVVIATDQHRGRRYRCPCGWEGWTIWGHAIDHAERCKMSSIKPIAAK